MTSGRGPRGALGLAALACIVLTGCPIEPVAPERPDSGIVCKTDDDCSEAACGMRVLCLDRRCASEPSLYVPCD